jgi:hypothetical protein
MSAKSKTWLAGFVPAWLLITGLAGWAFFGRTAQPLRDAKTAISSPPKVLALATDAALPPSIRAFSPPGPDLAGRVLNALGTPVPGARVYIDAARPRVGRGYT